MLGRRGEVFKRGRPRFFHKRRRLNFPIARGYRKLKSKQPRRWKDGDVNLSAALLWTRRARLSPGQLSARMPGGSTCHSWPVSGVGSSQRIFRTSSARRGDADSGCRPEGRIERERTSSNPGRFWPQTPANGSRDFAIRPSVLWTARRIFGQSGLLESSDALAASSSSRSRKIIQAA